MLPWQCSALLLLESKGMKKRKYIKIIFSLLASVVICSTFSVTAQAKKNVTVTPASLDKKAKGHPTVYDKSVAHSMSLNEITESMRKAGGGKLTLKKGTYNFQYSVCIPSNVTVVLKDGVVINNIYDTKAHIRPTTAMWQFVPKNMTYKAKSIGKYRGTKNAKLTAKGKVVFNMKNITGLAVIAVHCQKIEISGITFKGMNKNHYIEVNGAKNVKIKNCRFQKAKKGTLKSHYVKEAINIDLADPFTGGIGCTWAKQDKTPCKKIKIENCTFTGMSRGVGTHNYSQTGKGENIYHSGITIKNNTFKNLYDAGVYLMNWENTKIINNKFVQCGKGNNLPHTNTAHAISGSGVMKIKITGNSFEKIKKNPINFNGQENVGNASGKYKRIYVYITDKEAMEMLDNTSVECGDDSGFPGYDALYFRGDGSRIPSNAVGINFSKQEVNYNMKKGEK